MFHEYEHCEQQSRQSTQQWYQPVVSEFKRVHNPFVSGLNVILKRFVLNYVNRFHYPYQLYLQSRVIRNIIVKLGCVTLNPSGMFMVGTLSGTSQLTSDMIMMASTIAKLDKNLRI